VRTLATQSRRRCERFRARFLAPSTPPTTLRGALDTAAAAANAPAAGIAANDTADAMRHR